MKGGKKLLLNLLLLNVLLVSFAGTSAGQTKSEELKCILEERGALLSAFETIVDAVILNDMRMIKPALGDIRKAKDKKRTPIGEKLTQDRLDEFVRLTDDLYKEFEKLAEMAESGKKDLVKAQTHKLLDACVFCHGKFRN